MPMARSEAVVHYHPVARFFGRGSLTDFGPLNNDGFLNSYGSLTNFGSLGVDGPLLWMWLAFGHWFP